MILKIKDGSIIASGRVVKDGSELKRIGKNETPKFSFSLRVKNYKDENGDYQSEYLDCVVWGRDAESQQTLDRGDMVLVTGQEEVRTWTGRDGDERVSRSCVCDCIITAGEGAVPPPNPLSRSSPSAVDVAFSDMEDDDGEWPF